MTTDAQLDRIQIFSQEITGIVRWYRLPPTKGIDPTDLPCGFTLVGGMPGGVPNKSAGMYVVVRNYVLRVVVARATVASLDTSDEGAALLAACVPFLDRVIDAYMLRPRLSTAAGLTDLPFLDRDVSIKDNGPEIKAGPDGTNYAMIDFVLTIAEQRRPKPARLS